MLHFQLFSESGDTFASSNGLRELVPVSVGAATAKLRNPEHLFGLDEEIDRRLPRVRSLHLVREERY